MLPFYKIVPIGFMALSLAFGCATVKSKTKSMGVRPVISEGAHKLDQVELLPHQVYPIEYLKQNDHVRGLLINHYLGTGKTYLSLGFTESFPKAEVVVLVPRFLKSNWIAQMKTFGVKNNQRYQIVSFEEGPEALSKKDLSQTILIIDECHKLIDRVRSPLPETSKKYSELYINLRKAKKILALTGTPIYNDASDIAFLSNLVSGEDLLPFNEAEFQLKFMEVNGFRSFWRGYLTESLLLNMALPPMVALTAASLFLNPGLAALGGMVIGFSALPVINNFTPTKGYQLRNFKVDKLEGIAQKYISFYDFERDTKTDYPSKKIHLREVDYNWPQLGFFFRFADMGLSLEEAKIIMADYGTTVDPTYMRLNSTVLQKNLKNVPGGGREIGNLTLPDEEGNMVEAPKFRQIYSLMKTANVKTVIYSNYFINGIKRFESYLKEKGYEGKYDILHPDLPVPEQIAIVKRFNADQTQLLLLHPEITEGISLKGTRQFHIMEPVLNSALMEQIVGRSVRYKSHTHLPENEQHVDVYLWKSIINDSMFNPKAKLARKANWRDRYAEMSDWAGWGPGIAQVDKNYDRKALSPDSLAYLKLGDLKENMKDMRALLKKHAIESL